MAEEHRYGRKARGSSQNKGLYIMKAGVPRPVHTVGKLEEPEVNLHQGGSAS